ncbi:hypothetical protein GQ53DRAFT_834059 [Thozetella sp. PMI_491]|nr:hypothetical protein GQ53DRAFT_834059 [Thozetella sp. PMI_491]
MQIRDRFYALKKTTAGEEDTYRVFSGTTVINDVRVNRKDNSITADDVNNKKDTIPQRAGIFEVEMELFTVFSGKQPHELKSIHNENVSEDGTKPVLEKMAKERGNSISLGRGHNEQRADFEELMGTKLGQSANRLLEHGQVGKQAVKIDVGPGAGGDDDFNLSFYLS